MRVTLLACVLFTCSIQVAAQEEWIKKWVPKDHETSSFYGMLDSIKKAVDQSVNSSVGSLFYRDIFTGRRDSLRSLLGEVVLVNVWSIGCPPCIRELPILQRVQYTLKAKGFVLVTISRDDSAHQRRFLSGRSLLLGGITAMVRDEDCYFPFTTVFNPSGYIIDRQRTLRQFWAGPKTYEELIDAITPYL
jgi:thiol-disulfide isomerase/thioredoxin